jgi:DNA repair exonuclease SbcCD nuclease subunit
MIVFAADLHIRATAPRKRIDDYLSAQWDKLRQILSICKKNHAPLVVAGDFFNSHENPDWLISQLLLILNREFPTVEIYSIAGQHDLPGNNMGNFEQSTLFTLYAAGRIRPSFETIDNFYLVDYGEPIPVAFGKDGILVCHTLVTQTPDEFPGADRATRFIAKNRGYKLIVVGDNHEHFVKQVGKTTLISPGSMMRMRSDQANHKPCVVLYDEETSEFEIVKLKIKPGKKVLNLEKDKPKERNFDFSAYVEQIKTGTKKVSFPRKLEAFMDQNKTSNSVKIKVWEALK